MEADSYAYTKFQGGGTLKLFDYDCPVNVQGYDPTLGVKQYRIISGDMAYTHRFTLIRYHLVIHQAVHMPELRHYLLCPIQCLTNRVTINECPRIYYNNPDHESHAIVTEDEYGENFILPFFLNGVTSHLNVDNLSHNDFKSQDCLRLNLTHRDMTWDPSTAIYEY